MRQRNIPQEEHDLYGTLTAFRTGALRNLVSVTILGVFVWYGWMGFHAPSESMFVLPVAALFGIIYWLSTKTWKAAGALYITGSLIVIGMASYYLQSPKVLSLYRLATLVTVVIFSPGTGILTAMAGSVASYVVLNGIGYASPLRESLHLGIDSSLIILATWTLSRNLVLTTHWALSSYEHARESLVDARERRAQVIHLNQELGRARERLERANASLVRAWRAAEEAERRQKMMTAFISHELRTPLNLIVGFSEMLVLSPETYQTNIMPSKMRRDLNAIYHSSQQVSALIDDVLDMASSSDGHLSLLREPSDLDQVIDEAIEMLRDYMEAKGLDLIVEKEADLPPLIMDRLRIRQVLLNLLTNAARFTEQGSITVRTALKDNHVRVEVADTGRGIDRSDLGALFREFAASAAANSSGGRSTGLGLPMSRRLIELHGGEMGVSSGLGEGSTFWWTLPLEGDVGPSGRLTRVGHGADRHGPTIIEPTILVYDPDQNLTPRLGRWFEGYHLIGVAEISELAEAALQWRPLALLTDETSTAFSQVALPVVRCPLPSTHEWALRLGVAAYLAKPVLSSRLLERVRRLAAPGKRVLVVDDEPRFAELVQRILQSVDPPYIISLAYNGEEALLRIRSERPDLVLLDLALPILSGQEILREMKGDPALAAIPVMVISAPPPDAEMMPLGDSVELYHPQGFHLGQIIRLVRALLGAMSFGPAEDGVEGLD